MNQSKSGLLKFIYTNTLAKTYKCVGDTQSSDDETTDRPLDETEDDELVKEERERTIQTSNSNYVKLIILESKDHV